MASYRKHEAQEWAWQMLRGQWDYFGNSIHSR